MLGAGAAGAGAGAAGAAGFGFGFAFAAAFLRGAALRAAFFFFFAATTFLPRFAFLVFDFAFRFFAMIDLPIVSANVPTLTPTGQPRALPVPAALCPPSPNRSARPDGRPGLPCPWRAA